MPGRRDADTVPAGGSAPPTFPFPRSKELQSTMPSNANRTAVTRVGHPLRGAALSLAALVVAGICATPARAQSMKVAVIDIQEVLRTSVSGKAALGRLEEMANRKQEVLKQRQKELEDLQKQYNTAPLSGSKRDELETRIQNLIKDVNRFKEDARLELQKAEDAELKKLEDEVLPLIDEIGKKDGYQMVFGKFQSGLIYMDPALDITDMIIQRYDTAKKTGTLPKASPNSGAIDPGTGSGSGGN